MADGYQTYVFGRSNQLSQNQYFGFPHSNWGDKKRGEKKIMMDIVATNIVASWLPEWWPTAKPTLVPITMVMTQLTHQNGNFVCILLFNQSPCCEIISPTSQDRSVHVKIIWRVKKKRGTGIFISGIFPHWSHSPVSPLSTFLFWWPPFLVLVEWYL